MLFLGRVITLYKRRANDSGAKFRRIEIDETEVRIYKFGQGGSQGKASKPELIEVRPVENFNLKNYCKHGNWSIKKLN